jgi:hypothetical protein
LIAATYGVLQAARGLLAWIAGTDYAQSWLVTQA